jgi:putative restriction endonuclease
LPIISSKAVLNNFGNKCALSEISESSLLTASHIIPWAHDKDFRGDVSNGICLYVEYDALFDKGFISFTDSLEVMVTSDMSKLSSRLIKKLNDIKGEKLRQPLKKEISKNHLEYHRKFRFEWWLSKIIL